MDTSARQRGFEIRVFHLLGELPKAIEPHLQVFQLNRWQLGPNRWSSPTANSLDPIVVTVLRVGFPGKARDPQHVDMSAIVRSTGVDNGGVRAKTQVMSLSMHCKGILESNNVFVRNARTKLGRKYQMLHSRNA